MKPTKGQRIFAVFNYILLTLLALLCLLPMLNIVALSFSSRNMVNAGAVTFLPKEFTISSYLYMLQKSGLIPALLVTVKRLVLGVVLNLIMTISVAYPFPCRLPFADGFILPAQAAFLRRTGLHRPR